MNRFFFNLVVLIFIMPNAAIAQTCQGFLAVPIAWCVVDGSPAENTPHIGNDRDTNNIIWRRHERPSDTIYIPRANVTLRSGITQPSGMGGFPIIPDPDTRFATVGDMRGENVNTFGNEFNTMVNSCRQAYAARGLGSVGITAVNAGLFHDGGNPPAYVGTIGWAGCWQNANGICATPYNGRAVVVDNRYLHTLSPNRFWPNGGIFRTVDPHDILTGHEIGHALALPHVGHARSMMFGSISDTSQPPDNVADNIELSNAEVSRLRASSCNVVGTTSSVSGTTSPVLLSQDTVVEDQPRFSSVLASQNLSAVIGFAYNDGSQVISGLRIELEGAAKGLSATISGFVQVIVLIDNDRSPATGGSDINLVDFDFPAFAMQGIDYAVRVDLDSTGSIDNETFLVFDEGNDRFEDRSGLIDFDIELLSLVMEPIVAPHILPDGTQITPEPTGVGDDGNPEDFIGASAIQFTAIDGSILDLSPRYAVTALSVSPERGTLDVLGNWTQPSGTPLQPNTPVFPECSAPIGANPTIGEAVDIVFSGLEPNQPVHGLLGPNLNATGVADVLGDGTLTYVVPEDITNGRHLVTIGTDGTALTADCFLDVNND